MIFFDVSSEIWVCRMMVAPWERTLRTTSIVLSANMTLLMTQQIIRAHFLITLFTPEEFVLIWHGWLN